MSRQPLRITWYGDDFTGSTDAMEALTLAGIPAALFLDVPDQTEISQNPEIEAIGIAGNTRALSTSEIDRTLTPVLEGLNSLEAPICHYKVCSTFDSSPEIGSIGRAIEIGQEVFVNTPVPLLVGAPALGRYSVFGNLFARSGRESDIFRLDRHPTMKHHPVTPMNESDLREHLRSQTDRRIALFDILEIRSPDREQILRRRIREDDPDILLFDVLEDYDLPAIGDLIEQLQSAAGQIFTAGSSGIEYALTAWWLKSGQLDRPAGDFTFGPVDQMIVASGSCSPVTARQIEYALSNGFVEVPLKPDRFLDPTECDAEIERVVSEARQLVRAGQSVIMHSCLGPQDARRRIVVDRLREQGWSDLDIRLKSGKVLGNALGTVLRGTLDGADIERAIVAGGDTSFHVAQALGIRSLRMVAPTAPGSPLCKASAPGFPIDEKEIVFKGGQVGSIEFFQDVLRGTSN